MPKFTRLAFLTLSFLPFLPYALATGFVVYLAFFSPALKQTGPLIKVLEWILYILGALVLGFLLENIRNHMFGQRSIENKIDQAAESILSALSVQMTGLENISPTGEQRIDEFRRLFKEAKHEIFACGTAQMNVSRDTLDILSDKLDSCRVRILMLDPEVLEKSEIYVDAIEKTLKRQSFLEDVRISYQNFIRFQNELDSTKRKQFSLRVYYSIPTMNFYVTDHDTENAKMVIELFPYSCGFERPRLILQPRVRPALYEYLHSCFEKMWESARPI
jgi:hypothetical protein